MAGATGAIGRPLVPALRAAGHEVWAMSRSAAGEHAVRADALDAEAVERAADQIQPELVMQQLTALPQTPSKSSMREGYEQTSRLRDEGTRNLMEAAPSARVIAQSIAFALRPEGGPVKDEDAPLHTDLPEVDTLRRMEEAVVGRGGTVLRYGYFYGPGTWYSRDGAYGAMARKRMLGVWGKGDAMASFVHIDDAVAATVAAVEHDVAGVFNVVDDDPAPARDWTPAFCAAVGARPPRKIPGFLAKPLAGDSARFYLMETRGASNARFKATFGWRPRLPSWREGFETL